MLPILFIPGVVFSFHCIRSIPGKKNTRKIKKNSGPSSSSSSSSASIDLVEASSGLFLSDGRAPVSRAETRE
jgi:hypothetical protein